MLSYTEACDAIQALNLHTMTETMPLYQASGRILAQDIHLDRDVPGFDRATMDGYAFCLPGTGADGAEFTVIGTIYAGDDSSIQPQAGQAVKIMTGAPTPINCGIAPIECTDGGTEIVTITVPTLLQGRPNVALQGEDGRQGDLVLRAGQQLNVTTLAAGAMAVGGNTDVLVYKQLAIALCTTGNEVGGTNKASIHDSNGPLLAALLDTLPCTYTREHGKDDETELAAALGTNTLTITTGGVSMGDKDLIPAVAARLGFQTVFHKVAIQPGKPVLLCKHPDGRILIGLPGNPVSVLATAHLFVLPLLSQFWPGWHHQWLHLPLAKAFTHSKPRHLFLPAQWNSEGVHPISWNGSGDLLAAAAADGLMSIPPHSDWQPGDQVHFIPFAGRGLGAGSQLPARLSGN